MVDPTTVLTYTEIQGYVFAVLATVYGALFYRWGSRRWNRRATLVSLDAFFVSALAALTYIFILGGGSRELRWIASYQICSAVLLKSIHTLATKNSKDWDDYLFLYAAQAVTIVVVSSGFFIASSTLNPTTKYVFFAITSFWFLAIPLFLAKAIEKISRGKLSTPFIVALIGAALGWIAYPVGYLLGPLVLNVVDSSVELLIYNLADILSKILFHAALLAIAYFDVATETKYERVRADSDSDSEYSYD